VPALETVLSRAGDYVVRFQHDLSSIVAGETYVQDVSEVSGPGRLAAQPRNRTQHRELTSDLLLVRASDTGEWVQFRDVLEVDGKPVRDRSERLTDLFLKPSPLQSEQVRRVVDESARYNIGSIDRTINVPLLPLRVLDPHNQNRFEFKLDEQTTGGDDASAAEHGLPSSPRFTIATEVWVVSYREVRHDTIVRTTKHKDLPIRGRFWIEPDTGRVLMSELVARNDDVDAKINVSYQSEPLLGLLVPIEMHELYMSWRDSTRIEGTATYGRFRRFLVTTDEKIRQPPRGRN